MRRKGGRKRGALTLALEISKSKREKKEGEALRSVPEKKEEGRGGATTIAPYGGSGYEAAPKEKKGRKRGTLPFLLSARGRRKEVASILPACHELRTGSRVTREKKRGRGGCRVNLFSQGGGGGGKGERAQSHFSIERK